MKDKRFILILILVILSCIVMLSSCDLLEFTQLGTNPSTSDTTELSSDKNDNNMCTHTELETIAGYDATCTETGLTEGKKCTSCGEIIEKQKIIELKSHRFNDENDLVCSFCGFINSELPTFVASEVKVVAGDQNVAVTISLKNNPGVASIILTLTYDNTYLDLTKIEYNSKIDGQTVYPQELQSPATLYWINGFADTTGDWIFATLYFNVSEDAMGENDIQISYNPDNVYNIVEENLDFEVIHGKIIIE